MLFQDVIIHRHLYVVEKCVPDFVVKMWANAHEPYIDQNPCHSDCWDFINGKYGMIMFVGEQLPDKLLEENNLTEESDEDTLNDESDCLSSDSGSNSDMD